MGFKEIKPADIRENIFTGLGAEGMLVTAGPLASYNTMTAAWGCFGFLWKKNICISYVRPSRYTFSFLERETLFTLTFLRPEHRRALEVCGTLSGRDVDKAKKAGITPFEPVPGTVAFQEGRLILVCRKIYFQDLDPERFLDPAIATNYPQTDYHRMYIGEIQKVLSI